MIDDAAPAEPVTEAPPSAPPAPPPPSPTHPHALFAVGSMRFGLPIASVGEVVSDMTLTRLPHASKGLLGVVNLRGEILPAASLQPWFGEAAAPSTANLFLVVRASSSSIALRIDRFEQVVPVPEDGIEPDGEAGPRAEVAPQLWRRPVGDVHCISADALFDALRMKKNQPEETPVA
jgi:chemotaxis signal transduction protein